MEESGQLHVPATLPRGRAPEPVWTRWRKEKIHAHIGNRTSVVQPILTELLRLISTAETQ